MRGRTHGSRTTLRRKARGAGLALACGACLAIAAPASAHVERASYFPDPAPDTAVSPPAGGAVPEVRSLFTALDAGQPGTTRVVCQETTIPQPPANVNGTSTAQQDTSALKRKLKKAKRKHKRKKVKKLKKQIAAIEAQNAQAGQAAQAIAAYQQALEATPTIQQLKASIASAEANGYKIRPFGSTITLLAGEGQAVLDMNLKLLAQCKFNSIQDAVTASGNNDRVVIMPGTYTEPKSRAAPTFDPSCDSLKELNDKGNTGAVSYRYQEQCPNDQNLIAVIGRASNGTPPDPTTTDPNRRGIPDLGPCVRCNLQIEGSGVTPDDVIIDAGNVASGDGPPADPAKDVGIRADRADGFVLNNVKVRHAAEHGVYSIETDGMQLNRVRMAFNEEYGLLTFTADHSLTQRCDAFGSGDSGLYPGASADVGDNVAPPDHRRYGNEIRNCDSHHNASGYSGTDGNAVWVHDNEFYDNALGFTTDVFTAPGHPGFPQDSDLVEGNNFHSNNFNPYLPECDPGESPKPQGTPDAENCSDIAPTVPVPVGTGMWIAGGNHNTIANNHFYDNWRRGTMLFAVPDQLVCGPAGSVDPSQLGGCNPAAAPPSTSYNNEYHGNLMGQRPDGTPDKNGTDFWWDQFLGNTGNCWHDNEGPDGTRDTLTSDPMKSPVAGQSVPGFLPEDCATSAGTVGGGQDTELVSCLANFGEGAPTPCTWFDTPTEPAP